MEPLASPPDRDVMDMRGVWHAVWACCADLDETTHIEPDTGESLKAVGQFGQIVVLFRWAVPAGCERGIIVISEINQIGWRVGVAWWNGLCQFAPRKRSDVDN